MRVLPTGLRAWGLRWRPCGGALEAVASGGERVLGEQQLCCSSQPQAKGQPRGQKVLLVFER